MGTIEPGALDAVAHVPLLFLRLLVFALAGLLWGASTWRPPRRPIPWSRLSVATLAVACIVAGSWLDLPTGAYLAVAGTALVTLALTANLRALASILHREVPE